MLDLDALRHGGVQSGNIAQPGVRGRAPATCRNGRLGVVVLSQEANAGLGPAARYFALAAVLTALLGLLAAMVAGRRFTQPIRAASQATHADRRRRAGDPAASSPRANQHDELAELSRNVNTMAESLERSRTLGAPVPAVGQPRPADSADVDPWLRRGDRRMAPSIRHGRRR